VPFADGERVFPKTLFEIYRQQNQSLPEVKAPTSERLTKCRSRIDQAIRNRCLERNLAHFSDAVKKAQLTLFLRGRCAQLAGELRLVRCELRKHLRRA
jgi:hypothetical protein